MAISDADILAYVQANINDPAAIASAAQQYGVSADDLSRATGYDTNTVNSYFQQANVTPYWSQPQGADSFYTPQAYTSEPQGADSLYTPPAYTPPAYTPPPVVTPPTYTAPATPTFTNPLNNLGPINNVALAQSYSPTSSGIVFEDVNDFGIHDYYSQPEPAYTPPQQPTPIAQTMSTTTTAPTNFVAGPVVGPGPAPTAPVAPTAPKSLVEQILAQGTTSKWTGQGYGSAEANAADMAKILSGIGITDISQFGKVNVPVDVAVNPVYDYRMEYVGGEEGYASRPYIVGYTGPDGKPVDASKVQQQIQSSEAGDTITYTAPVGTQETFGNKLTGQAVPNTYGERQTGDAFGGTYAGSGNTGYRVQFDEKGNPFFYTSGQSSSDAGTWMPLVQLALAATGAGGLLGNALLGAGAGAVATNALGNAIISGALTGVTGGDVLKGALLGGAGGALGGYLQGALPGGTVGEGGLLDGSKVNFNDLAEVEIIDALKARGLTNQQINQFLENASAAELGWTGGNVTGPVTPDVTAPVTTGLGNVEIVGQNLPATVPTSVDPNILAAVTNQLNANVGSTLPEIEIKSTKVPEQVDPSVLNAITSQLNANVNAPIPTVEIVGDKTTKTTETKDTNVPTVEIVGTRPVTPEIPTVEIVGDRPVTPEIPTVEIVDTRPVTPEIPTVEIVDTRPTTPVVPTVEVVAPRTPVVEPPPVVPPPPPVVVPPVVLPPPPPPPPPVVVPPPVYTPPTTNGIGLNPGLIETTPFYNTTNPAQARYYWGSHGFQTGPAFNAASYNAVAAPETPWGSQGVAQPLSAADYENIIMGRPFQQEQFTPATRVQAYNPALLQTPVGQINVGQGSAPVTGPAVPPEYYVNTPGVPETTVSAQPFVAGPQPTVGPGQVVVGPGPDNFVAGPTTNRGHYIMGPYGPIYVAPGNEPPGAVFVAGPSGAY